MRQSTIEQKEEYKETELGLLPESWRIVNLGDCLDLLRNGITKQQNIIGKGYPVTRIETISKGKINLQKVRHIDDLTKEEIEKYKLIEGDIIFSHINSEPYLGNSAIYEGEPEILIHGMNLLLFRTDTKLLNSKFLNYLFNYYRQKQIFVGIASRAVNQSSINQGKIKALKIFLPPRPEQLKITHVLSTIQTAQGNTDRIITSLMELKKAMMKHLFTYGPVSLEETKNVKMKETEIGLVPENWEIKDLKNIATLQRGKDLPKQNWKEGPVPIIGSSGIMGYHNEVVCKGPGVITGRSGSIGKLTYVEDDYWPHNTSLYVKNFHGNNPKFIYYLMHTLDFKKYTTGVSVPTLNRNFIHMQKMAIPPLQIQKKVVEILSMIDIKINTEETKKNSLNELFKSMLHNLMTAKIRVNKLVIPNEENGK